LQQLRWSAHDQGKSPAYFEQRYLKHPFYRYRVFLLEDGGCKALMATRTARRGTAAALRLIDFHGDTAVLAAAGSAFETLMQQEGVEHADFLNAGLPQGVLEAAGFACLDFDGPVTVPNRYEPLEIKNHRVHFAVKTEQATPVMIFRGDGDQDRPNLIQGNDA